MKMHIQLRCVGRLQEPWHKEAVHMYATRCKPFGGFEVLEVKEGQGAAADPDVQKAMRIEAQHLLNRLPDQTYTMALDQGGKTLTSEELARTMADQGRTGRSITFIVGGSWGLDKSVLDRADLTLSLGRITLPHSLARVVLAEQIYRAHMIIEGRKYHK